MKKGRWERLEWLLEYEPVSPDDALKYIKILSKYIKRLEEEAWKKYYELAEALKPYGLTPEDIGVQPPTQSTVSENVAMPASTPPMPTASSELEYITVIPASASGIVVSGGETPTTEITPITLRPVVARMRRGYVRGRSTEEVLTI